MVDVLSHHINEQRVFDGAHFKRYFSSIFCSKISINTGYYKNITPYVNQELANANKANKAKKAKKAKMQDNPAAELKLLENTHVLT
jgi:hypothetical protein